MGIKCSERLRGISRIRHRGIAVKLHYRDTSHPNAASYKRHPEPWSHIPPVPETWTQDRRPCQPHIQLPQGEFSSVLALRKINKNKKRYFSNLLYCFWDCKYVQLPVVSGYLCLRLSFALHGWEMRKSKWKEVKRWWTSTSFTQTEPAPEDNSCGFGSVILEWLYSHCICPQKFPLVTICKQENIFCLFVFVIRAFLSVNCLNDRVSPLPFRYGEKCKAQLWGTEIILWKAG